MPVPEKRQTLYNVVIKYIEKAHSSPKKYTAPFYYKLDTDKIPVTDVQNQLECYCTVCQSKKPSDFAIAIGKG